MCINLNEIRNFRYQNTCECISILNRSSIPRQQQQPSVNANNDKQQQRVCHHRYRLNERNQPEPYDEIWQNCELFTNEAADNYFLPIENMFIVNTMNKWQWNNKNNNQGNVQHLTILEMPNEVENIRKRSVNLENNQHIQRNQQSLSKSLALRNQRFY